MSIFSACTKTIVIDIKDVDKKLVVDAEIGNHATECVVKLSKSISYANDNTFPGFSGATVTISDQLGNTFQLPEAANGIYKNDTVVGVPGNTYSLKIIAEGKTYTSICKMPMPITIDSIDNSIEKIFGKDIKVVRAFYNDDGTVANYYRYFKTINGARKGQSEVNDDVFQSGITAAIRLGSQGPTGEDSISFVIGNLFGVTLQNVDKAVYTYFNSKAQNTNGQSGAPANPETNIVGGALGYFNAYTSDYKTTIMK
jgi:hypothetical protein